jgi:hypothetical protein
VVLGLVGLSLAAGVFAPSHAARAAVAYMTGFETGDASEINTLAGGSVQGSVVNSGAYALKQNNGGLSTLFATSPSLSTLGLSYYVKVSQDFVNITYLAQFNSGGNPQITITYDGSSGHLSIGANAALGLAAQTPGNFFNSGIWTLVRVAYDATAGGVVKVWVDNTLWINTTHSIAGSAIDSISVSGLASPHEFYYDDFVLYDSAAQPANARVIARQFISTAPSYDAFTKSTASTIDTVWNETPFNATNNASSGTSGAAQTAYVASFSTTQTGHGSQTIGANDTIVGAKVGLVAKTSATTSGGALASIRRRIGSSDTDTGITLTTGDAYYEAPIFLDTLTNLNSAQAGFVHGANTKTQTVEDAWLMVAYTPAPILSQEDYIFEDDSASSVNQNTSPVSAGVARTNVEKGERFITRFLLNNSSGTPTSTAFQVQYDRNSDNNWNSVTSGEISIQYGISGVSGSTPSARKTAAKCSGGSTFVNNGQWYENRSDSPSYTLAMNNCTELAWVFSTATATVGTTYRLRLYNATAGKSLDGYTATPTLTIVNPQTKKYSKTGTADGELFSTPSGSDDLVYFLDATGYAAVAADDAAYDTATSFQSNSVPISLFKIKNPNGNNTDQATINWNGQTNVASQVDLEVWNGSTWENVQSNASPSVNTDFTLTGAKTGAGYYDASYFIYVRAKQAAGAEALRTDLISASFAAGGGAGSGTNSAVQVTSRIDTLSDSRPSATSNHSFAFTTNTQITGSSTITLTYPGAFTIPGSLNCGDVDAATSSQFSFNYPGCAATATAWGFSVSGPALILQAPTDSTSTVHVATGTPITIKIGSNATYQQTGAHWITNPSTPGVYTISVGGTFGGSGNLLVSINSGQTVQATVAENLSFTVGSGPQVTPALVQAKGGFCTTCSSVSVTPNSSIGSNHLLIVFALTCIDGDVGCTPATISDTANNAWSVPTTKSGGTGHGKAYMWYTCAPKSGSDTITVNEPSHLTSIHEHVYEVSGILTSNCLDTTGTNSGTGSTATSVTTQAVTQSNEYVAAFFTAWNSNATFTQGGGYTTEVQTNDVSGGDSAASEDANAKTGLSGQQTATMTKTNTSDTWIGIIAAFIAASNCAADDGATVNQIASTATSVPFGFISPNIFYQGCQDLTVSTNAMGGYSLTVQEKYAMQTANGLYTIPDTTCDAGDCTVATATTWVMPTKYGLGHTCWNVSGSDCSSSFSNGTKFRSLGNIAAGTATTVPIMANTGPVATSVGRAKYRLSASPNQQAGTYSTIIMYTLTPTY